MCPASPKSTATLESQDPILSTAASPGKLGTWSCAQHELAYADTL